ncbi:C-type lectin domain family 7 member A isoform X3 [Otolemur garnettii]|uniref:C-type lectin domain family 7 member A isoform X3 n=1 Tax=Otolemur garnettii TaxID=30611 RepID=UPI000C7ED306|nr:C-type lectin domain family 7 member A isoform X3 [Otolemur garnettii]
MAYHSDLENLDEDGYTQLYFNSQGITRKTVVLEKGTRAASPPWRLIAVTLGILCLIILVIAVVLGTMGTGQVLKELSFLHTRRKIFGDPIQRTTH